MDCQRVRQFFVRFPDHGLPTRALTLDFSSTITLSDLKILLFPLPQIPDFLKNLTLDSLRFTSNGKPLLDSSLVFAAPSSWLTLSVRLRGGGGDGGATGAESRDCYLNMYASKKPDKVDPNETRLSRWTTCALSYEPLSHPAVIDRLGNLFNKEALVEALIHKKLPKEFGHIRGLKDMIPIHLCAIPGGSNSDTKFQCPITGLEFNGKYGFVAIRGCGHVLSVKALKEVKSSACLICHKEFQDLEKIPINGSAEEVAALRERMMEENGKLKEKKEKKVVNALSGLKRTSDAKVESFEKSVKDAKRKWFKAEDMLPANATKEIYASIFTSSKKSDVKETYMCRSLPLGRN